MGSGCRSSGCASNEKTEKDCRETDGGSKKDVVKYIHEKCRFRPVLCYLCKKCLTCGGVQFRP